MKTLYVIPARGGSKGIPGKNIKPLGGKPLIAYSVEVARALADDTDICVSTDSQQIADVVRLQMNVVKKMLVSQGFTLEVTDAAIEVIADAGFDPEFGARPVKRAIQRDVLNDLSKKLLAQEVSAQQPIVIDAVNHELVFRN